MPQINEIRNAHHIGKPGSSRFIYVKCLKCERERWIVYSHYLKGRSQLCQSCSMKKNRPPHLLGENHWNWNGGRHILKGKHKGYVQVYVSTDDFYSSMRWKKRSYVTEHRLVMAKYLGRCLQSWEVVHHKNGIKTDNRIENLELATNGSHSKQHSEGYKDGFLKGYNDGSNKRIRELLKELETLKC